MAYLPLMDRLMYQYDINVGPFNKTTWQVTEFTISKSYNGGGGDSHIDQSIICYY